MANIKSCNGSFELESKGVGYLHRQSNMRYFLFRLFMSLTPIVIGAAIA